MLYKMSARKILRELADNGKFTLKELSLAIGRNPAYLQQFITRGSPRELEESDRLALAEVLKLHPDTLREKSIKNIKKNLYKNLVNNPNIVQPPSDKLYVRGEVQAGYWKEAAEWPEDEWFEINAYEDLRYKPEERFGVIVKGDSMDKSYPEGTILDCVCIEHIKEPIKTGQHVIVERQNAGKYETTVKIIKFDGDKVYLCPNSNNPDFQACFIISDIGTPSLIDSTIIKVVGLVIWILNKAP